MQYAVTNIRVEAGALKELKHRAVEEGRRVAELVREAIREYLRKNAASTARRIAKNDPLLSIIGICKTKIKDGSEKHDEQLYGSKKR
ncbi:MAG: ribbon-helix-helix protein, CopG family [Candidatus Margulisbacteria bacterium]|nr:ribbon-helix-helix protein, CopG family [Candidatus Margulisiibacteriota bacterium]